MTGREVDRTLDLLRRLTIKYCGILYTPCHLHQLPVRQFNYEAIFRRPWIAPVWKRRRGHQGTTMKRHGELWPSPDQLPWSDYLSVRRKKTVVVEELGDRYREWSGASPIREWLVGQGLPESDAAVMLVRDLLGQVPPPT